MKNPIELQPTDKMPRVSRKELCERFDELLETVSRDSIGIVISDEGKDDLVLCPAEWFDIASNSFFDRIVSNVVKHSLCYEESESQFTIAFIRDSLPVMDIKTLVGIDHNIDVFLDPYGEGHKFKNEWYDLQREVKAKIEEYRDVVDLDMYYQRCFSIGTAMDVLKDKKAEAYKMVERIIREIQKGFVEEVDKIEDFMYMLMDYGDDVRFYELYKSLREVLQEKYPQLVNDGLLKKEEK